MPTRRSKHATRKLSNTSRSWQKLQQQQQQKKKPKKGAIAHIPGTVSFDDPPGKKKNKKKSKKKKQSDPRIRPGGPRGFGAADIDD